DESFTDQRDGGVGRVGYEINFNRYFYEYEPPRPLEEIEADIRQIEREIIEMLGEVGAGPSPGGIVREGAEEYGASGLPSKVEEELRLLRAGLHELYGDRLRGLYLYGSYARGDARWDSDLDVLVVLDEVESTWKEIERTSELRAEL